MATGSFLKRILGELVHPSETARAGRRARQAADLCRALLSERGEVSGAVLAREVLSEYQGLPQTAQGPFFDRLAAEFAPARAAVLAAADAYRDEDALDNLARLQAAVEPPRQELFRRLNMAPGGTAALIAMRSRVLAGLKANPEWRTVDADLAHLLGSWFNRGFLTLERIDWHTPAIVLEKLIAYEAVHQVRGWRDLRRRLEADRRCFAFFHPVLPDEPLIFIEVALTRGLVSAVQPLLDPDAPVEDPDRADTAIFYSITNCQDGLRGISFGNLLIKQVAEELGRRLPRLRRYATLSPLPGFREWLQASEDALAHAPGGPAFVQVLERLNSPGWQRNAQDVATLQPLLTGLCAHYLLEARHGSEPADPVARFHLSNGARLERLNWLADVSDQGMRRAAGLMVNYVYDLDDVEKNHEAYVRERRIAASRELRTLARECPLARKAART